MTEKRKGLVGPVTMQRSGSRKEIPSNEEVRKEPVSDNYLIIAFVGTII